MHKDLLPISKRGSTVLGTFILDSTCWISYPCFRVWNLDETKNSENNIISFPLFLYYWAKPSTYQRKGLYCWNLLLLKNILLYFYTKWWPTDLTFYNVTLGTTRNKVLLASSRATQILARIDQFRLLFHSVNIADVWTFFEIIWFLSKEL